jgi:hypothetical protein
MQRPPLTPPARRWYQRYALIEHDGRPEKIRILSWHVTAWGANSCAVQLLLDNDVLERIEPFRQGCPWWRAVPRSTVESWGLC